MRFSREALLELEASRLAPYAQKARDTRGRAHPEPESLYRTPYQKDRDRILHTTAFRRLEYKTQVLPGWAGDYYRTRLTHTLEVAQVSRSIARALGLNEDLTEAIALSHDLGHPLRPHGEHVLNALMQDHGGFEHNAQALRILTHLEVRYPGFRGLNLTYEVLEGIATHEAAYSPGFKPLYEGQGTLGPRWWTSPTPSPTPPTTWTTGSGRASSTPRSSRKWSSSRLWPWRRGWTS